MRYLQILALSSVCGLVANVSLAAPCLAPVTNASNLTTYVASGCSPITFADTLAGTTITAPSQLRLQDNVTLDGQTPNGGTVTLTGKATLTKPLIRIEGSGVTIKNLTLSHGVTKVAVLLFGAGGAGGADNATITNCVLSNNRVGIYVGDGIGNTFSQNSFSGNQDFGIQLAGGNGGLAVPIVVDATLRANETHWDLTGTGPAGGTVELYLADPNFSGAASQGETYLASATVESDGSFAFVLGYPATDPQLKYTLLATDVGGSTSQFTPAITPDVQFAGFYTPADLDNDLVLASQDNCPSTTNALQTDGDGDGVGDACDNCVNIATANQNDKDTDNIGDACDVDADGDGVLNSPNLDNCPLVSNADQADSDHDGVGDVCDVQVFPPDSDGDGLADTADNCPFVLNAQQEDTDSDLIGNACDEDNDNDGITNNLDNCPFNDNKNQIDSNGDGTGDACETSAGVDSDGDGLLDTLDNCPTVYNLDQTNTDQDNLGDECDSDDDGDGILDVVEGESDLDNDGIPNRLDIDSDGDGTLDAEAANTDENTDGIPDFLQPSTVVPITSATSGGGCSLIIRK